MGAIDHLLHVFLKPIRANPANSNPFMQITTEIIGYIAATLTTVSFLPQAVLTIRTRDTQSLSLSMYSLFTAGVLFWLIYGLSISDKAIILANSITFALAFSILAFKIYNTLRGYK